MSNPFNSSRLVLLAGFVVGCGGVDSQAVRCAADGQCTTGCVSDPDCLSADGCGPDEVCNSKCAAGEDPDCDDSSCIDGDCATAPAAAQLTTGFNAASGTVSGKSYRLSGTLTHTDNGTIASSQSFQAAGGIRRIPGSD